MVGDLANVVLPADCRLCGAAMMSTAPVRVCAVCVGMVDEGDAAADGVACSRCGETMGMESARFRLSLGVTECAACRLAPPAFERAVAGGEYDDRLRELLHELKYGGRTRLARYVLGGRLAEAMRRLEGQAAPEVVVVPVPLFRARERERGFNQATLLAAAAVRALRRSAPGWTLRVEGEVLARVKDTRALHRLTPRQRRDGLRGAFRVRRPERVAGREVLLVDDILTTGATARECARVLRAAGAGKVWVATVARVQPEQWRFAAERVGLDRDGAAWTLWDAPADEGAMTRERRGV